MVWKAPNVKYMFHTKMFRGEEAVRRDKSTLRKCRTSVSWIFTSCRNVLSWWRRELRFRNALLTRCRFRRGRYRVDDFLKTTGGFRCTRLWHACLPRSMKKTLWEWFWTVQIGTELPTIRLRIGIERSTRMESSNTRWQNSFSRSHGEAENHEAWPLPGAVK